ncbi:hypothetical protein FIBSPDRAFT_880327, partial [Athelia psychrophila]
MFKPRVGGLGVQGRQDAEEVAAISNPWSESEPGLLAMQPAAAPRWPLPAWVQSASDAKKHTLTLASIATHVAAPLTGKGIRLHSACDGGAARRESGAEVET